MKTFISSLAMAASIYASNESDRDSILSNIPSGTVPESMITDILAASCEAPPINARAGEKPAASVDMCQNAVNINREADKLALFKDGDLDDDKLIRGRNGDLTSPSEEGTSLDQFISARKLKQLKVLILWLQPEHRFARYCFYGCYCLPDADHKIYTVGYGKPVDNIDGACKKQSQCYDCAAMDHADRASGCDASTQGYNFKLHFDPADPTNHWKKSIQCTDDPKKGKKGSCKRSVCECDKKLAEDLREHYHEWFVGHHQEQGTFDSSAACIPETCKSGDCGKHRETQCCGYLGSGVRMPFKTNGRRKCCGDKTYDSAFQECCDGNILAATGTC